jgi:CheY-like chemotaxis protein
MTIKNPIIIVDDDEDDHYLMKRVCEKIGVKGELIFFSEGEKLIHFLKNSKEKPFIILSDVNMPMMNGLELRRRLFEDETLRRKSIPFIFFSTAAMASIVNEAYDLTVQGFFIKDQSIEKMEKTLKLIFEYWYKCEHPSV